MISSASPQLPCNWQVHTTFFYSALSSRLVLSLKYNFLLLTKYKILYFVALLFVSLLLCQASRLSNSSTIVSQHFSLLMMTPDSQTLVFERLLLLFFFYFFFFFFVRVLVKALNKFASQVGHSRTSLRTPLKAILSNFIEPTSPLFQPAPYSFYDFSTNCQCFSWLNRFSGAIIPSALLKMMKELFSLLLFSYLEPVL